MGPYLAELIFDDRRDEQFDVPWVDPYLLKNNSALDPKFYV